MPEVRLSNEAENDLDAIAAYTISAWGSEQADRYLIKLETGFRRLATHPSIGRRSDALYPGLRRFEIEHHVAFYMSEHDGILIVRVLHHSMLPSKHFGE